MAAAGAIETRLYYDCAIRLGRDGLPGGVEEDMQSLEAEFAAVAANTAGKPSLVMTELVDPNSIMVSFRAQR